MARSLSLTMTSAAVTLLLLAAGVARGEVHRVCGMSGTVLYYVHDDLSDAATGTRLDRYEMSSGNPMLMDSTTFGALAVPSPAGVMWGDGVGYASTMQTRSMWMHNEGTTEAYWDVDTNTGDDTWRFRSTASGGGTHEVVLRTLDCPSSLQVVPPPPTTSAPVNFKLCGQFGDVLYEVCEDQTNIPEGTKLKRYNMTTGSPVLIDTNLYAWLYYATPRSAMWGDGVAYASTMQTRFAWMYPDPTLEGYWDTSDVVVQSAGFDALLTGHHLFVKINGAIVHEGFAGGQDRGLHVVVLNSELNAVVDAHHYDTYASTSQSNLFAAYINGLPAGTNVLIAVLDEATSSLTEAGKLAAESVGSARIRQLTYRGAWAIFGRKGAAIGSVPESLENSLKLTQVAHRRDTWRFLGNDANGALTELARLSTDACPTIAAPRAPPS